MDLVPMNIDEMAYLRSESEFKHARMKAFLETMLALLRGHSLHLLSFSEVVEKLRLRQTVYLGLRDIPVDNIVGSTGRYEDFTRHFLPRSSDERDKERWRKIFMLATTGKGFPPIDVYKIDQVYFVIDGNHRVSVAHDLGWDTIQAHVTELPTVISLEADIEPRDLVLKEEAACFVEKTELHRTRPESKQQIDFTAPGSYHHLLTHIELHRFLLEQKRGEPLAGDEHAAFVAAAADWYDSVFEPMLAAMRESKMIQRFPGRSGSDLYLWLVENQAALRERHQLEVNHLPEAVADFLDTLEGDAG